MVVIELVFDFKPMLQTLWRSGGHWTRFRLWTLQRRGHLWTAGLTFEGVIIIELAFIFEIFEGVVDSTYTSIGSFPQTRNLSSLLRSFWHRQQLLVDGWGKKPWEVSWEGKRDEP